MSIDSTSAPSCLVAAETTNRHQEALILILADIHSSGAGSPAA